MAQPLHDWVCDTCGKKIEGRRKVPRRCHATPMRPMGSPWKFAIGKMYDHAKTKGPGYLSGLPDDYWISQPVLVRLQAIVDADPNIQWESSVKRKDGYIQAHSYDALQ